jgi:hypothetical protein
VKQRLTIAIVGAALAATLTFAVAGSFKREPATEAATRPAYEIITTLISMGIYPIGEPVRRGPYYILHAYDRRGIEVRVVADARFGDILSVAPATNGALLRYQRGPRIIHVPQARASASVNDRDEPAISTDDDDGAPASRRCVAPAPQRQDDPPLRPRAPRWQPRSDATPPLAVPRRAVLSSPPPPAEGPTPIRPIPRFNSKADPADKFGQPRDARSSAPPLPAGNSPPSEVPDGG